MNIFKRRENKLPTKGMLTIRVVIGGYLMYLAYTLFTGPQGTMARWQVIAFSAFFVLAGIAIIGLTAYLYFNGLYEGGKGDVPAEDETVVDEEKVSDNDETVVDEEKVSDNDETVVDEEKAADKEE